MIIQCEACAPAARLASLGPAISPGDSVQSEVGDDRKRTLLAASKPRLTHHDLTVDQRVRNLFAVVFAGPSWTWRDLGVLDGLTVSTERRARMDPPSLETGALPIELRTYRVADGN